MLATLYAWNRAMGEEIGLPQTIDEDVTDVYLALTDAAAHDVVRPAAPFSALFAGWLYGTGRADSLEEAAGMVGETMRSLGDTDSGTAPDGKAPDGTATQDGTTSS